ncbi:MAG: Sialic acid-specific 9-O-acetylesterase [Verrucomicrobiales bacterium]|nr:Sialic acid-specific 9-O-acetylesterase [Verrucomicrobiales bacterium]
MTLRKLHLFCASALLALTACETNPTRLQYANAPKYAEVALPKIFSDNMVLQQGMVVPVWGWGPEGEVVTVTYGSHKAKARVKNGQWVAKLHHLQAGDDAHTLTITTGDGKTIEFKNVVVGEVWLASGQSNMEFKLNRSFQADQDIAAANNPDIRFIDVPNTRLESATNNIGATWTTCTPESAAKISAVAYYFARALNHDRHVPVGIIESDWGGTPAEAWTPRSTIAASPTLKAHYMDELDKTPTNLGKPRKAWHPGELYNGMIAPLEPYAFRGAIWYQGEANAHGAKAKEYRLLLATMITKWRQQFGHDFPFLIVQLAPFKPIQHQPADSDWAMLRESQSFLTHALPKVGVAVITDVGDEHNIHPTKKQPVGQRLELAAQKIAYGENIDYSGPTFQSMHVRKDKAVLTFDNVDGGLVSGDGALKGFSICGPDHKFVWAVAEIEGNDKVVVSSPAITKPVAVRYGWADYPVVNLWNKAGLPASPFRTDDF